MRKLFTMAALSVFLVTLSGCSEFTILSFKNNTTNADTVTFADANLQQCWNDAVATAKENVLPAPLGFWTVAQITNLLCHNYGITDVSDISNASGVNTLVLTSNSIGSLDLGYMPFLTGLSASGSDLSTTAPDVVNLSGAEAITDLNLSINFGIEEIDLSANSSLRDVNLSTTNITAASIINKPDLNVVQLALTPLVSLDLNGNPSLEFVNIGGITGLDTDSTDALNTLDSTISGLCVIYLPPYDSDPDCTAEDLAEAPVF
ncbi:MAG: hypothetical protein JKY67_18285 [Pseudomonadales bacterium]|nr:hypothetical protein [Pseudomonadales bacterium]